MHREFHFVPTKTHWQLSSTTLIYQHTNAYIKKRAITIDAPDYAGSNESIILMKEAELDEKYVP